jgi:hypothetical protein
MCFIKNLYFPKIIFKLLKKFITIFKIYSWNFFFSQGGINLRCSPSIMSITNIYVHIQPLKSHKHLNSSKIVILENLKQNFYFVISKLEVVIN